MITYVTQPGDMLGVLAVRFKTTIRTLMKDNSEIPWNQNLTPGMRLRVYTPEENAKRHSDNAYEQIEKAAKVKDTLETNEYMLKKPREPVYYKDRFVDEGQVAFGRTLTETPLLDLQSNGYIKTVRMLSAGEILRIYETTTYNGGMYLVDGYYWITNNPETVLYDPIPQYDLDGKIDIRTPRKVAAAGQRDIAVAAAAAKPITMIGSGEKQALSNLMLKPQSMIGSGTAKSYASPGGLYTMKHFQRPGYKRPVLKMVNAAGGSTTVEMRVLGFSASYSTQVSPSQTNGGWMISIRGNSLPTLNISGFLMETRAANEFDDFMTRYHKYLKSTKVSDYYSMGISTLFYKNTEYRGIVTAFNYSDREAESLHRKYSMQMIVLKEKSIAGAAASVPTVIDRKGKSEVEFRSDIGGMLANPILGTYNTDYK